MECEIFAYVQNGLTNKALQLFKEIPPKNVVSWNTVIGGLSHDGQSEESLKLFLQMLFAGVKPDSKIFINILPVCSDSIALGQGMEIHAKIIAS